MLKKLLVAGALLVSASAPAWPQAAQFPSGWVQGNSGATAGQGKPNAVTAILDRALGSTRGNIAERGSGGWVAVGPGSVAGVPWVSNGAGADPAYQTITGAAFGTQSANLVFAGPGSGIAANPTFRSLVGADLPNPSATTLGGVKSLTCSASNWFNTISTAGGPACSQPNFTDLAGSLVNSQVSATAAIALSKLASIGANVVVGQTAAGTPTTLGMPSCSGANNALLWTSGTGFSCNTLATGGTVTSVTCGTGLSGGTFTTTGTCAVSLTSVTNSLGANVNISVASTYASGPSVAQGASGIWEASGTVTLTDSAGAQQFWCKLWDGTNIIASGSTTNLSLTATVSISLSGTSVSNPPGNIRIDCRESGAATTGSILFNATGNSKDSTVSARRIQ